MKLREFTGWLTDKIYMEWSANNYWKVRSRLDNIELPSGESVTYDRVMELKTAYERYYFKTQTGAIPRGIGDSVNKPEKIDKREAINTVMETDKPVYTYIEGHQVHMKGILQIMALPANTIFYR